MYLCSLVCGSRLRHLRDTRGKLDVPILKIDVEFPFLKYLQEELFVVRACCRKQAFVYISHRVRSAWTARETSHPTYCLMHRRPLR